MPVVDFHSKKGVRIDPDSFLCVAKGKGWARRTQVPLKLAYAVTYPLVCVCVCVCLHACVFVCACGVSVRTCTVVAWRV